jgi:ABC-type transport system involved in multi-copper enzyme maturation permease subunit
VLNRILVLVRWTALEALRERILYVVLLFAAVLVASSCVLTPLAPGAQRKVVADFGLATISALGMLVVLLSGAGLVKREIERRSLDVILTRPVSRLEYLTGKCLGLVATLLVLVGAMTVVLALALELTGFGWHWTYLYAIGGTALELLVVASLAVLFSTFTSPTLASLFTLGLFAAGHLSETVLRLTGSDPTLATAFQLSRWLVPALGLFDVRSEVVHGVPVPMAQVVGGTAYALAYALLALYAASLVFRRRELR